MSVEVFTAFRCSFCPRERWRLEAECSELLTSHRGGESVSKKLGGKNMNEIACQVDRASLYPAIRVFTFTLLHEKPIGIGRVKMVKQTFDSLEELNKAAPDHLKLTRDRVKVISGDDAYLSEL